MHYIQPLIGAAVILGIGYVFSTDRKAINWETVAWGLGLQIVFAFIVLILVLVFRPSGLLGERVGDRA